MEAPLLELCIVGIIVPCCCCNIIVPVPGDACGERGCCWIKRVLPGDGVALEQTNVGEAAGDGWLPDAYDVEAKETDNWEELIGTCGSESVVGNGVLIAEF